MHASWYVLKLAIYDALASTNEGDTVLDPFSGSGTTGIAANLLGRKYIGIEQENSFVQLSLARREALEDEKTRKKLFDKMRENAQESTVLINHMREKDRELAMQAGLTYMRAGDSKGSLLVKQGFERLGYLCLHTNGNEPKLYKLKSGGFRIWTAEALRELGFSAENAPYYAVLRFEPSKEIDFDQEIDLHMKKYTQVAHIEPIRYFIGIR